MKLVPSARAITLVSALGVATLCACQVAPPPVTAMLHDPGMGFEEPSATDEDRPAGWDFSGEGADIALDTAVRREGVRSLRVAHPPGRRVTTATRAVQVGAEAPLRVRLSGQIRTEDVEEGWAGLWVRADGPDGPLALENLREGGGRGTTGWTQYEVELVAPRGTTGLAFGTLLVGGGTAWFDGLALDSSPIGEDEGSEAAVTYFNGAADIIRENALFRDRVEWAEALDEAQGLLAGAEDSEGAYPAIRYLLAQLGDRHSRLVRPPDPEERRRQAAAAEDALEGQMLDGSGHAYIRVPAVSGWDSDGQTPFIDALHRVLRGLRAEAPCGWVVDLRSNTGGTMWPMLAGLAPVLGDGEIGAFAAPGEPDIPWSVRSGAAFIEGHEVATGSTPPTPLGRPPVAVLIGPQTASSGEAVAVAFRGRARTRFFGRPTAGLTTSNQVFRLSDGAVLILTTAAFKDRTGRRYDGGLSPDTQTTDPLREAVVWLDAVCATSD